MAILCESPDAYFCAAYIIYLLFNLFSILFTYHNLLLSLYGLELFYVKQNYCIRMLDNTVSTFVVIIMR